MVQVNIDLLTKSIERNRLSSLVRLLPFAVGSAEGLVSMQVDPVSNSGNGEILFRPESSPAGRQVVQQTRVVRLDQVVTEPIAFLKIDTEGYEQRVLRGASSLLRNSTLRPVHILMEFSPALQAGLA
jgi:FkbM family methyltransferase